MTYLNGERTAKEGEDEPGNAPPGVDVMIFDLHSGDPYDYKLALQAMQKAKDIQEEKVIVVISSLMVWNNTPRKFKNRGEPDPVVKEEGEEGEEAEEEPADKEEEEPEAKSEGAEPKEGEEDAENSKMLRTQDIVLTDDEEIPEEPKDLVQIAFTERDYKDRQPTPEYQLIKDIEDELLAFEKENVKVYVVAAGVLYGNGENIFNQHFKQAWLQEP